MPADSLNRATYTLTAADLEFMLLDAPELPPALKGFVMVREGVLDNDTMAQHGFATATAERFRRTGRITGFMREFTPEAGAVVADGLDVIAGVVAHLFDSPESVSHWMHDVFLKDFQDNVGQELGPGHRLISAQRLEPGGFFDEAVALKALHEGPAGPIASTVVDFRVGRILGVAFVGAAGDYERLALATELGLALEKRIVRVALGVA